MAEILRLSGVNKVYGEQVQTQVLFDVNYPVHEAEFSAIIGRSGSGKSTMLNIVGTLDKPTSGTVVAEGVDVSTLDEDGLARFRHRTVGFIFQFHYLLPEFSALENVLIPYRIAHGRVPADVENRAKELLAAVGVTERMNNRATNLSGGQQQRVAIARSLINSPKLVLADEPTGNLDSDSSDAVMNLLRQINRDFHTAFVVVTHDRHIAARCDRVVEMNDGRIVRDFRTADVDDGRLWDDLAPCWCKLKGVTPPGMAPA